jgi:ABC-type multidrug transport system ATPase subunit/pSer/pThr/pTyr-binding forkhead associated (FHA) protein
MPGSPGALPAPELPAESRLALVVATVGHADTSLRRLRAPARDAADLSEVLADPRVGGFEVTRVIDRPVRETRLAVEGFFTGRSRDDLVVVYLSCHGLVDGRRRLYFAAADTRKGRLAATGLQARWLLGRMEDCRARRQVVILDCCFSGASAGDGTGETELGLGERFHGQGRSRVVLTASRSMEYSFDGEPVEGSVLPGSVFTGALVAGIRTGAADADHDGYITVDDAYAYASDHLRDQDDARQSPQRWLYGAGEQIVLARSPVGITVTPPSIPDTLRSGLGGSRLHIRVGAAEATVPAGQPFVVGRARNADFVIPDSCVSRRHLMIEQIGAGWRVRDVGTNGTWIEGQRMQSVDVHGGEVRLRLGTPTGPEVVVQSEPPRGGGYGNGDVDYDMPTMLPDSTGYRRERAGAGRGRSAGSSGMTSLEQQYQRNNAHPLQPGSMRIGRARDNAVIVSDLLASRHHAELHVGRHGVEVVDLESANGTFVNDQRVTRAPVGQGDVIAVGHHVFQLEGDRLVEYIDSGDVGFEADGLNVFVGEKQLMHDVTFRLPGRALLGVVGPSGAGKSVLLDALTGLGPADTGFVRYAGRDVYSEYDELRGRIGYVPREDLLHTSLTVRTALEYGARLRLPPDVTEDERRARVDEVLAEFGLAPHADTRISRLSGRRRKRTNVALELLTRPPLLYVDEPTSDLDAGMDNSVMESLRTFADGGRTVVVVTDSVEQLDLCDYVLVLAPGGYVAYFGPPGDALSFFGEREYLDVFRRLAATPGNESAARFRASRYYVPASITAPSPRPAPEDLPSIRRPSVFSQMVSLVRRTLAVVASDRSYLGLVVAFPFLLGLIPRFIPGDFKPGEDQFTPNSDAGTILLVMVLCACFMGMANSVREIVKERAIYRRERTVGLSRTAYIGSKVLTLALITSLQAVPFTLIALVGRAPADAVVLGDPLAECLLAVIVVSLSSAMLGLVVSALVDNADKTMPLLVLITMTQLVFSGGILPVEGKAGLEQVGMLAPARWGYAALASVGDLNTITLAGKPDPQDPSKLLNGEVVDDPLFDHTASAFLTDVGAGVGTGVVCVIVTSLLIRRMEAKIARRRPAPAGRGRHPARRVVDLHSSDQMT